MLNFEEVKCIIWDLDETLWEGTLEENDNVVLSPGTRSLIEIIDGCGVIQTICSKNDPKRAEAVLREMQEAPDTPEAIATLPRLSAGERTTASLPSPLMSTASPSTSGRGRT